MRRSTPGMLAQRVWEFFEKQRGTREEEAEYSVMAMTKVAFFAIFRISGGMGVLGIPVAGYSWRATVNPVFTPSSLKRVNQSRAMARRSFQVVVSVFLFVGMSTKKRTCSPGRGAKTSWNSFIFSFSFIRFFPPHILSLLGEDNQGEKKNVCMSRSFVFKKKDDFDCLSIYTGICFSIG